MTIPEVFREFEGNQVDRPSPLMNALCTGVAQDWDDGGVTREILAPFADSANWVLPLRFAAALHRLVLVREAPELALYYPTVGGFAPPETSWPAAHRMLVSHAEVVSELTALPCQTNEVGRCVPLLAGLLHIARITGQPLRLLEIGSSAGLLLAFDRYQYGERSGPADALCRLPDPGLPDGGLVIADRAGCDLAPIDPTSAEGRLQLTASIWGDQVERFERLRGALAEAARRRVVVEQAGGAEWLARRLPERVGDSVTVVWHSVVHPYVDPIEWSEIERLTAGTPDVWRLSYESESTQSMARRIFGRDCPADGLLLARGGGHGVPLTLLDG